MATLVSKVLTCSSAASTLVSNWASFSPLANGLGPFLRLSQTPLLIKTPSSRPSLVMRAQQSGGPKKIEPMVTYIERTPCNTSENEHEIRMWFDMPGLAAENLELKIIDDLLIIKGDGGVDGFGNKITSPFDNRVQLQKNSYKEDITAVLKNGVLYITVPKITKSEGQVIQHVPVRSIS